ncbi:uncharacterized protein DUF3108 [Stella humosa]|uniref:Uncharacterized protein DUF3108 n=1 Tax=Stella humosa TaxID=94 RepID=A0A3N1LWW4_9PROT|nr:DUF3108 domain-containing protein [Stella humosa]ROP99673.1 uncharacterized protein DUF3108 [Stella humosa]BBK31102.1 hypothetical protein STHU_17360 [Stella humosa]
MRSLRMLGVLGAWLVLGPAAALAAPKSIELQYDVYTAGLPTLALKLDIAFTGEGYRVAADMQTQGLAGFLFPWHYQSVSEGVVAGGDLRPALYRTTSTASGKTKTARLVYRADGTVAATAEPAVEEGRDPVPPGLTRGSVDILTAVLRVTRRLESTGRCDGEVPVYDGLRRYDLVFSDGGLDRSNAMTVSAVRRCSASMRRLAGFLKTLSPWDDGDDARAAAIAVASLGGDLPLVPVRLDLATPIGMAYAELASVKIDGRALPAPGDDISVAKGPAPRR